MKKRLKVIFQGASMVILVPIGAMIGALWAIAHLIKIAWALITGWN